MSWGIGVAVTCCASAAAAQTGLPERRVDISVNHQLTYDSNVVRSEAGLANGGSREDYRATPSIAIDIVWPISRQALFLNGSIGYDFYQRNRQLNSERIGLIGGVDLTGLASCSSRIAAEYSRRQSDLGDLFNVGLTNNVQEQRAMDISASCGAGGIGLTPSGGFRHETVKNNGSNNLFGNNRTNTYNAALGYTRPTFGTLSVYGTYSDSAYSNRLLPGTNIEDGVEVYSAGLRFQRQIGSRLSGTVSVGFTKANPKLPGVDDFSGLSYSGQVLYMPSDPLQFNLAASRSVNTSNLLDVSYSVTDLYSFDGQYAFGRSFRLLFGSSYQTREFEDSPLVNSGALLGTEDETIQGFVGLRYLWNDRLSFDLDFTQERRNSDVSVLDYKSTRIGFGMSLSI